ncbi:sirohydrochlorin chelatase [Roseimaritima sediminicola]|uniref:sirohydrochlorin chelatase n=1 Tax=Roseimaritima sediminicola TaxID=2662066 RepID=UPI0012982F2C|nr:sirohydrochlorin chelatase [Roseimaritima sediminicola]
MNARHADSPGGLLIVGHGTRCEQGAAQFAQLIERLRGRLRQRIDDRPVEGCFLELRPPDIAEAWQRLVAQGVRRIHAVPLLLFSAGHAKRDIPAELHRCASATPGVALDFGRALSRRPQVIRRSCQRVLQAAERFAGAAGSGREGESGKAGRSVLVMVGRGTPDVCAQADMRLFSECVFRTLRDHHAAGNRGGFAAVRTAFYAMAQPALPGVLDAVCRRYPDASVVVQPHLLFAGQLERAIEGQVAEARRRHPGCRLVVGRPLGPHRLIVDALSSCGC